MILYRWHNSNNLPHLCIFYCFSQIITVVTNLSNCSIYHLSSVQLLSRVWLSATPWIAARQASLSITNSRSLLKLMPIKLVMPSSHLILCCSFSSCLQSLPASGSFPMSQFFAWGGQSIGVSASASVLPMNTQDWSPLGQTGWISLQSKGLSSLLQHHRSKASIFNAQLSSQSNSHTDHWKNHSLD